MLVNQNAYRPPALATASAFVVFQCQVLEIESHILLSGVILDIFLSRNSNGVS